MLSSGMVPLGNKIGQELVPVVVNGVLLEPSHACSFIY